MAIVTQTESVESTIKRFAVWVSYNSLFGLYGKCTISTIGTIGTKSTIEHFWAQLIILEINFF